MDAPLTYFHKTLIASRLYGVSIPIRWVPAGDGDGVLATSDSKVIAALRQKIAARVGGVRELSKEEYDAKKAEPVPPKRHVTQDPAFVRHRIGNNVQMGRPKAKGPVAPAAGGDRPAFPKADGPVVGKISNLVDGDAEPA